MVREAWVCVGGRGTRFVFIWVLLGGTDVGFAWMGEVLGWVHLSLGSSAGWERLRVGFVGFVCWVGEALGRVEQGEGVKWVMWEKRETRKK